MKSKLNSIRFALFAAVLALVVLASPARAQFVMGNVNGPGNLIVQQGTNYATNNTQFFASYLTGTAYTLTASAANLVGGTTSPTITLPSAGTYFIYGDVDSNYVGSTFAANQTETFQIARTNNTPATLSNSPAVVTLNVVTTFTGTAATSNVHGIIYTTATTGDVITIQGVLSVLPSAGTVTVTGGGLYALRLY